MVTSSFSGKVQHVRTRGDGIHMDTTSCLGREQLRRVDCRVEPIIRYDCSIVEYCRRCVIGEIIVVSFSSMKWYNGGNESGWQTLAAESTSVRALSIFITVPSFCCFIRSPPPPSFVGLVRPFHFTCCRLSLLLHFTLQSNTSASICVSGETTMSMI